MERSTHAAILQKLALPLSAWPHFHAIAQLFGVSFDTVFSIYSLEVQTRVLRTNHVVKAAMAQHAQAWLAGVDAVQLAFQLDFPPCVLMRRLLEHLQLGLAKERITRVLRQPETLPQLVAPDALRQLAAAVLAAQAAAAADGGAEGCAGGGAAGSAAPCAAGAAAGGAAQQAATAAGPGAAAEAAACSTAEPSAELLQQLLVRLQADVEACVMCDRVYSPASDAMRHSAGQEYEQKLNAALQAAGVAFWTEDQLRSKGYHKTPDARLQVPIAVQGRIVNWIDSKATFGDDKLHRQQTADQYERYVNRFGPGLVIYWHGYLADLNRDDNVLLMDRFPSAGEIVQLPCLPLTPAPLPPGLAATADAAATSGAVGAAAAGATEAAAAAGEATAPADVVAAEQEAAAAQHTPARQPRRAAAPDSSSLEEATPVRC